MTAYVNCRTCGRIIAASEAHAGLFCSKECVRTYHTCLNCGKHFLRSDGFDEDHCSKACTVKYVIQRTYGPQPVNVLTEV
jgi:endogenous inhibitor of DNA gyrase (YacG/DUF329 family)